MSLTAISETFLEYGNQISYHGSYKLKEEVISVAMDVPNENEFIL